MFKIVWKDTLYNAMLLGQMTVALALMITSTILLFKQLNRMADVQHAFYGEKKVALIQ